MNIVGFDIALASSGVAVLDYESGELVDWGTHTTAPSEPLLERVASIGLWADLVLSTHTLTGTDVGIEDGFVARSGKTTRYLAMAWASVALAAHQRGFDPYVVSPAEVKQVATGNGRAPKGDVFAAAMRRWTRYYSTSEPINWSPSVDGDALDACWVAEATRLNLQHEIVRLIGPDAAGGGER